MLKVVCTLVLNLYFDINIFGNKFISSFSQLYAPLSAHVRGGKAVKQKEKHKIP